MNLKVKPPPLHCCAPSPPLLRPARLATPPPCTFIIKLHFQFIKQPHVQIHTNLTFCTNLRVSSFSMNLKVRFYLWIIKWGCLWIWKWGCCVNPRVSFFFKNPKARILWIWKWGFYESESEVFYEFLCFMNMIFCIWTWRFFRNLKVRFHLWNKKLGCLWIWKSGFCVNLRASSFENPKVRLFMDLKVQFLCESESQFFWESESEAFMNLKVRILWIWKWGFYESESEVFYEFMCFMNLNVKIF